ncbi:MAG: hypothetical protein E6R05_00160 [Candidatus Moraniibacteriota bacterium]|nr:MAG: hypothetical protein E6R05_00160 [Candidatus Moranbacteria bacterium]
MPGFLLLTLFPTGLIARRVTRSFDRLVILLLPLSSASIIIYFLLPIPQALINVVFTFFILLLLHALFTKNNFFSFLAGITLLLGYFYHDMALLFLVPWVLVTLVSERKTLGKSILTHKLSALLLVLLLLPYHATLAPIFNFFKNWLVRIFQVMERWEPNFAFPLAYVNIDGRAVGWGNALGVAKYYLFYGGPLLLITLTLFLFIILSSKQRKKLLETCSSRQEMIILLLVFLLFFSLAEVLPRFLSISLLPERALGFASLASVSIIPLVYFLLSTKWRTALVWLVFMALCINTGAALYINSLKKDLISPARIASMEWIKKSLPDDRVMVVQHDLTIMKTFSQTESILEIASPTLYTDISLFDRALEISVDPTVIPRLRTAYAEYLRQTRESTARLQDLDPATLQDVSVIKTELAGITLATSGLLKSFPSDTLEGRSPFSRKPVYIYYAKQEDSLYTSRPYYQSEQAIDAFVFDSDPRFVKIYSDEENQVFIWKLKLPLP